MLDYIELAANQTIDNLLPSLLIGHTYYIKDSTTNEYKEYVLVPKKKEYVDLIYDKDKVEDILVNKLDEKNLLGIDLELPSGTIWAKCNVGAEKPSDYGLYFQWGDTTGYKSSQIGYGNGQKKFANDFSDYKWYNGGTFTKYTTPNTTLELEDDAANKYMKGNWHMPTYSQLIELEENTTNKLITQNGVNGRLLTSKINPSKSIFIPMAGSILNGSNSSIRNYGFIWSSTVSSNSINYAWWFGVDPAGIKVFGKDVRCFGLSVRGVIG